MDVNFRLTLVALFLLMTLGCERSTSVSTHSSIPVTPSSSGAVAPSPSPSNSISDATSPPAQPVPSDPETLLWSQLQQAEIKHVVLLRHALAPGVGDPANFRLEDCSTQRNLSAEGREQAIRIGAAFQQRQIPVAKVLSSQWCRCLETARLMNIGRVEPFPALNSFFNDRSKQSKQTNQVREFISQQDSPGVVVMVTHQVNITAITNIVPESGEAVVLKLNDADQIEVIGRLIIGQASVAHLAKRFL